MSPSTHKLHAANPDDAYRGKRFIVNVNAGGLSNGFHLLCWGHADDALEAAIQWCADHAPGLLCTDDEEAGGDTIYADPGHYFPAQNIAFAFEDPTRAQLLALKESIAR